MPIPAWAPGLRPPLPEDDSAEGKMDVDAIGTGTLCVLPAVVRVEEALTGVVRFVSNPVRC